MATHATDAVKELLSQRDVLWLYEIVTEGLQGPIAEDGRPVTYDANGYRTIPLYVGRRPDQYGTQSTRTDLQSGQTEANVGTQTAASSSSTNR